MDMHRLDIARMMWTVEGHCSLLTLVRNSMDPSAKVHVTIVLSLSLRLKKMFRGQQNNWYVIVEFFYFIRFNDIRWNANPRILMVPRNIRFS
jgi:hypothetical protein